MVLTERAWKLIPGQPTPDQSQSSDLLDSPNGVGPIFFTSAPSSLALSPLGPCTMHRAGRYTAKRRCDGGARVPGCGVPNGANGALLQPTLRLGNRGAHCLGLSSCGPPQRVIVQSTPAKSHASPVSVLSAACHCFSLGSQFEPRLEKAMMELMQEQRSSSICQQLCIGPRTLSVGWPLTSCPNWISSTTRPCLP